MKHIVSINQIEQLTGIIFLPELEANNETLATTLKVHGESESLWEREGSWPGRLDGNCD